MKQLVVLLLVAISGCVGNRFSFGLQGGTASGALTMTCAQITPSADSTIFFRSPGNYPYRYPNNIDACWLITSAEPDQRPRIRVTYSAVEALYGLVCSAADFIEVRDGSNLNDTLLLRWCGWGHPNFAFEASGDALLVYFHSDSSIAYGGFEMKAYLNETAQEIMAAEAGPMTFPPLGELPERGLRPRPSGGEQGADRDMDRTTPNPGQRTFNNDGNSRNQFENNLRQDLAAKQAKGQNVGMIVGIVIAVMLGVALLGLVIHVVTKACLTKSNAHPLQGVIIPQRRSRPHDFDNLECASAATVPPGGAMVDHLPGGGKYALPGPQVSAPSPGGLGLTNHAYMTDHHHEAAARRAAPPVLTSLTSASPPTAAHRPEVKTRSLLTTTTTTSGMSTDMTSALGDVDDDVVRTPRQHDDLLTSTTTQPAVAPTALMSELRLPTLQPQRAPQLLPPLQQQLSLDPPGVRSGLSPPPLYSVHDNQPLHLNASHVSLPPAYDDIPPPN